MAKELLQERSEEMEQSFNDQGPMKIKKGINMPIWLKALIALFPALIFLVVFTIYPIINTTFIAFIENFRWQDGMGSFALGSYFKQLALALDPDPESIQIMPAISVNHFLTVLTDKEFLGALGNTAILTIISVPLTILISLLLAVALNSIKPLKATFQTIFFLPYVTNAIALGLVFNTVFSHEPGGIMNQLVVFFGGQPISWIRHGLVSSTVLPQSKASLGVAIIVQTIWSGLAFKILVFMSGLASVDRQYYDAARIDGTKKARIFSKITVPLLSPQILYITITSFIGAFKAYQSIISIVGMSNTNFGGVNGKQWLTVVGYIYVNRTDLGTLPIAAAGSVILLIIILLITLVQMQVSKKRVHY